jgi:ABC-2 type transport system permease protein
MKAFLKEIKKHINVYGVFVRNSILSQMEYRFNFFIGIVMELGYLFVKLLYVLVIFRSGANINGFSPNELLVFVGTFIILTGFHAGLFMVNFGSLRSLVREGMLDLYIVKPVSLQFISTLRRSDLGLFLIDVTAGIIMVVIGLSRLHYTMTLLSILGYAAFIACGVVVGYALFLVPQILSFWFVNTSAIGETFNSIWDINNVPMVIYNKWIQRIGVFVIPIFVITNFPSIYIVGKMSPVYFIWGFLAPVAAITFTRLLWKVAVKNYTSTGS